MSLDKNYSVVWPAVMMQTKEGLYLLSQRPLPSSVFSQASDWNHHDFRFLAWKMGMIFIMLRGCFETWVKCNMKHKMTESSASHVTVLRKMELVLPDNHIQRCIQRAHCLTRGRFSVMIIMGFAWLSDSFILPPFCLCSFISFLSEEQGNCIPSVLYTHLLWPFPPWNMATGISVKV